MADIAHPYDVEVLTDRLTRARAALPEAGIDALVVTPGADLRYLTGYDAVPLERLTALVVRRESDPVLVVPGLERPAALASPVGALGLQVRPWPETADPFALVADLVPATDTNRATTVAVDDGMPAAKVLALRDAMPAARQVLGGSVLRPLRARKDPAEVAALRRAGEAIDRVHVRVPEWLRAGRSEREVARDISEAILAEGHVRVDFVIVAGGPNGASPHHEVSDRTLQRGDAVVVDIGGTMPDGYRSDCTRTYAVGTPDDDFLAAYAVLQQAQEAGFGAATPGLPAEEVDAAARKVLAGAGYGELFVHRLGHGIGLETHEEPYLVSGNAQPLQPGMAFSIEPGVYLEGRWGARIEDIVVCTADGAERLDTPTRELVVVDA